MQKDKKQEVFEDIENTLKSQFEKYKFKDKYKDWKHLFLIEIKARSATINRVRKITFQEKDYEYVLLNSDFKFEDESGYFYDTKSSNLFVEFGERVGIGGLNYPGVNIVFDKEYSNNKNLIDCVAIHEVVESITDNHKEACFQELHHLFSLSDEEISNYANILFKSDPISDNNFFERAIPKSFKLLKKQPNNVERLKMFYQMLCKEKKM